MPSKKTLVISGGVILSLCLLALLVGSSYDGLTRVIAHVRYGYLFGAVLAALSAYVCMGLSLREALRLLGHKVTVAEASCIAVVATTVNYFVSSMGMSGFALRAHLLKKRNVPFAAAVTSSVIISVILYSALALIVLEGALWIVFSPGTSRLDALQAGLGAAFLALLCSAFFKAFFDQGFRSRWIRMMFRGLNHVIYWFSGGQVPHESFARFEDQLEHGICTIKGCGPRLAGLVLLVCGDWVFTIIAVYMGFLAVHEHIALGPLISGFAMGQVMTLIPVLPGGLGAMELTMTAAYAKFGVPWDAALVACLIFRLAYYAVPALLSVFIYWGLKLSEPLDLAEEREQERRIAMETEA
ncbi:MAG: lysylphosphatidylglycerol synthase transmembrane domain-containing protein [Elusimicrobiales bacterium]